ncbi:hypothetical protein [Acinetobacter baumannii]|uniref:hypothetical protein n=1 Tax=Acinetobacter baumannii TaxID=470 RepID=UPI003AF43248
MFLKILTKILSFIDSIFFVMKITELSKNKADFLIIQHTNNYGYVFNGKKYAHLTYSAYFYLKNTGCKVVFLDKPFSKFKGNKYYPCINVNFLFIFESLSNYILRRVLGENKSKKIRCIRRQAIWSQIIEKIKPKNIIGIQPENTLCTVAKKNNIKIYDLQHGVINKDHYWYGTQMHENSSDDELPTGIIFWDEVSAKNIEYWTKNRNVKSVVVGNPWLNRFIQQNSEDELVSQANNRLNFLVKNKPVILVSLQWGLSEKCYADSIYDYNGVMCKSLEDVIVRTADKYHWLLRLHPVQMNGKNAESINKYLNKTFGSFSNVEWVTSSEVALPALLSVINLHITDISTVVTEAAYFGVKSALLNPFLEEGQKYESYFLYERQQGFADIVEQKADVIEAWIETNLERTISNVKSNLVVDTRDKLTQLLRD